MVKEFNELIGKTIMRIETSTVKKLMLCFIGCEIGCLCVVMLLYHTFN